MDTFVKWTLGSVPLVSVLKRFDSIGIKELYLGSVHIMEGEIHLGVHITELGVCIIEVRRGQHSGDRCWTLTFQCL